MIGTVHTPWFGRELGQQKPIVAATDHRYRIGRVPHLGPVVTWAKLSSLSQARAVPTWSDTVTHLVPVHDLGQRKKTLTGHSRCYLVGTVTYFGPVHALYPPDHKRSWPRILGSVCDGWNSSRRQFLGIISLLPVCNIMGIVSIHLGGCGIAHTSSQH